MALPSFKKTQEMVRRREASTHFRVRGLNTSRTCFCEASSDAKSFMLTLARANGFRRPRASCCKSPINLITTQKTQGTIMSSKSYVFDDKRPFFILKLSDACVAEECYGYFDVFRNRPDDQTSIWIIHTGFPFQSLDIQARLLVYITFITCLTKEI